jgi:hypothetical protein
VALVRTDVSEEPGASFIRVVTLMKEAPGARMPSSGMLHLVGLVIINVSEEINASIMRVTRIGEL